MKKLELVDRESARRFTYWSDARDLAESLKDAAKENLVLLYALGIGDNEGPPYVIEAFRDVVAEDRLGLPERPEETVGYIR